MNKRTADCRNDHLGLIHPQEIFNRPLPDPLFIDADRPFIESVRHAWRWLKTSRLLDEKHDRRREVQAIMIAKEVPQGECL